MPGTPRYRVDQLLKMSCGILDLSADSVLRRAGLPANYLSADSKGATAEQYMAIWSAIEEAYGQGDLAEKLGIVVARGSFVPAFFAFSCSPNLRTGMERLAVFKPLIGPLKIVTEIRQNSFFIQICPVQPNLQICGSMAHSELVMFTELFRNQTAVHVTPLEITAPQPYLLDKDFFGCKVTQKSMPSLTLTLDDANRPLVNENAEMWSVFEPRLRRQLAEHIADSGIGERLRNALLEAIPSGEVNAENVAAKMHMSKRSLQRHLSDEGTSFQKVLDDTRADLARHYLSQSGTSLDEVSYLLGYTSPASFFRAFQNWFGTTPAQYRRTNLKAVA